MTSSDNSGQQATLSMTGESYVDEYGEHNRWDAGGVYDEAGEFDLGATKELLEARFDAIRNDCVEAIGTGVRTDLGRHSVTYQRQSGHGVELVSLIAVGPHLHEWTVAIMKVQPGQGPNTTGRCSYWLDGAAQLDTPQAAFDELVAYLRGVGS